MRIEANWWIHVSNLGSEMITKLQWLFIDQVSVKVIIFTISGNYKGNNNRGQKGGNVNPRSRLTDDDDDVNMDSASGHTNRRL